MKIQTKRLFDKDGQYIKGYEKLHKTIDRIIGQLYKKFPKYDIRDLELTVLRTVTLHASLENLRRLAKKYEGSKNV